MDINTTAPNPHTCTDVSDTWHARVLWTASHSDTHSFPLCHAILDRTLGLDRAFVIKSKGPLTVCVCVGGGAEEKEEEAERDCGLCIS